MFKKQYSKKPGEFKGAFKSRRRKVCRFCENKIDHIDHKDDRIMRRFTNERGKIIPRRVSGNCAKHQRKLTRAIKRGRVLAIMPFESESFR